MQSRCRLFVCLAAVAATLFTIGCGSSSANIRLVNAVPTQSSLDLLVDSKSVATAIGYGAASAYSSVSSGSRHVQAETSGSTNIVVDLNPSLGSGSYNTVVASGIGSVVLTDSHSAPSSANFSIRVVNASANLATADVYVVTTGTDINTVSPTYSSLTLQSAPSYMSLPAGSYQIIFTFPGQKFAFLTSSSLSFTSGQVRTVLGLDGFGGGGMTTSVLSDLN